MGCMGGEENVQERFKEKVILIYYVRSENDAYIEIFSHSIFDHKSEILWLFY